MFGRFGRIHKASGLRFALWYGQQKKPDGDCQETYGSYGQS